VHSVGVIDYYGYLQIKDGITSENYGTFGTSVKIEYSELFAKTLELTLKFSFTIPLQSCYLHINCIEK
jgi:hypothetical protein